MVLVLTVLALLTPPTAAAAPLEFIRPSPDGKSFVLADSGRPFQLWGVNYDHDGESRLLEDYWHDQWPRVVEDFREIKALNANSVRIHLQLGRFMDSANQPNARNLAQLARLIKLAEDERLYLIITGLGCYHKQDVPVWYDRLPEAERWQVQARFWRAVAAVGAASPAVLAYDLMNEPILTGGAANNKDAGDPNREPPGWLAPPLGDKHFVQRITLDLAGRTREQVAQAWVETLAGAIREVDDRHMLTVGVIPWRHVFPGAKPLFYAPEVGARLDFVSVHFYPKRGEVQKALDALAGYELGKPLVVEEIFPLHAGADEVLEFIDRSKTYADGWVSFYWGDTVEELEIRKTMPAAITADWLKKFQAHAPPE